MKKRKGILLLFAIFYFAACATSQSWVYRPEAKNFSANKLTNESIAVLPFDDARPNENVNRGGFAFLPLMPFGWITYQIPDGQQNHITSGLWVNYKPVDDFGKALASELENAGLFKESSFESRKGNFRYVIQGSILNTELHAKIFSYGLSIFYIYLWILPVPSVYISSEMQVELSLLDTKTNKAVFSKKYSAPTETGLGIGFYHFPNDFKHSDMLKYCYKEFIQDLRSQFPNGLK
ncbi:hypothetical protein AB3N61_03355 [Leptospira sp. WS58.C1]|uniref:hypothetical protein n=1 Tax=Leptospira cinconiae TaxID=3235173 RepID=UPI00349E9DEA